MVLMAGCAKASVVPPGGTPTPGPTGSPASGDGIAALKLDVLTAVGGRLDYCDPDSYPVAHGTQLENAKARLPQIKADQPTYHAILDHEGITSDAHLTDAQLIAISEDYKQIQIIELRPSGDAFAFSVQALTDAMQGEGLVESGTVDRSGHVEITSRTPGLQPNCPICLAFGVRIATPNGPVAVQDIRAGMSVWSTDLRGRRVREVVMQTGRTEAPLGHQVVRLELADGRIVFVSPGHPTSNGTPVGELMPGDPLDGSRVVSSTRLAYRATFTYDLLPSGPTGTYWANGILLGSTLRTG
jgi:hypothetical protein